jgi:GntR family transcriptional repressor for pyruvate dehydrogenase complex
MSYLKGLGVIEGGKGNYYRVARLNPAAVLEKVLPVAFYTTPDPAELLQLRRTLELGLIEEAVEKAVPAQIRAIEAVVERMQALTESAAFTPEKYDELEVEFHQLLAAASGSRLLCVLNEVLHQSFAQSPWNGVSTDYRRIAEEATINHRMLAGAFRLKDPTTAYSSLRRQLKKN